MYQTSGWEWICQKYLPACKRQYTRYILSYRYFFSVSAPKAIYLPKDCFRLFTQNVYFNERFPPYRFSRMYYVKFKRKKKQSMDEHFKLIFNRTISFFGIDKWCAQFPCGKLKKMFISLQIPISIPQTIKCNIFFSSSVWSTISSWLTDWQSWSPYMDLNTATWLNL